jgi:type 1 glutamine amidotransferase
MIAHDGRFEGRQVLSPAAIKEMEADQVRGASVKVNEFPESIGCGRYNGVYGLGEWRLAFDAAGEVMVLSSPAYSGFFPWIDKRHGICGVFAAKAGGGANIDAFHTAPKLFQLIDQGFPAAAPVPTASTASPAKIKVLIVDGYSNHDWPRTTRLARGILERSGVCEVSVSTVPVDTNDPAYARWLPAFRDFDVVVQTCNDLGHRGPPWPAPAQAAFEEFVRGGGGVFILHSGNNAFADWPAYNQIIGLGWRPKDYGTALRIRDDESIERIPPGQGAGTSHGPRTDRVIHRLGDDPVHAGLPRAWKTPLIEVYTYARGPAENVTVLSWAEEPTTHERWPIEWTVQYGAGRVYNSTFGHVWADEADPVDMRCAGFQTIFVRAMQWLAKQPVTYPVPADFPTEAATSLRP